MPLFSLTKDTMLEIGTTSFSVLGYKERDDLQRLLRVNIDALVPDGFVISEEFGNWDDSKRRIDLLVLDRLANLVVVELKRTEDGGHMDLQALRYAAMISTITFEQAVDAHRSYLAKLGIDEDPQVRILDFLNWPEPDEDNFAKEVRIVLASAEFSKELTTAVIWLNDQGLDIRCVRMRPYIHDDRVILDIQQLLPLPEAQDYQIRVREKISSEKSSRREQTDIRKRNLRFWEGLLPKANQLSTLHLNTSPSLEAWLSARARGLQMNYVLVNGRDREELYIARSSKAENKQIFDELFSQREKIEGLFGGALNWERLDGKQVCRVSHEVVSKGNSQDEDCWGQLQDDMIAEMIRLETAIGPLIQKYRDGANAIIPEGESPTLRQ